MSRIHSSLAFALVALLSAGCGREPAAPSAATPAQAASRTTSDALPAPPRACMLVTAAEAQTVIGQAVSLMADEAENCMWASAGHPGQITMFMVQIVHGESDAETRALYESLTGLGSGLNAMVNDGIGAKTQASGTAVAGLGDAAWRSASNADMVGSRQLVVRKGLTVLVLNITGMDKGGAAEAFEARMEAAGRTALSRMGD